MNIVYISYWGINEPLSQSAVLPYIKILAQDSRVHQIMLFTFERGDFSKPNTDPKVSHTAIIEKKHPVGLNKFLSFYNGSKLIIKTLNNIKIDLIICRTVFSGILGVLLYKKLKAPFVVDCFEPHLEYMIESKAWKKNGLKSFILAHFEKKIKQKAWKLIPVTQNYYTRLLDEGIALNQLMLLPCVVPVPSFAFNLKNRDLLRSNFGIDPTHTVGIYVGKFSGIYLEKEAFMLFKAIENRLKGTFFLIILSTDDPQILEQNIIKHEINKNQVLIHPAVAFSDVERFLSAADFAFSLQKQMPSNNFLSPIKNGLYWANSLPVLISKGVGDDANIIEKNNAGVVFDIEEEIYDEVAYNMVNFMLHHNRLDKNDRSKIEALAHKYRSFDLIKNTYSTLLDCLKH